MRSNACGSAARVASAPRARSPADAWQRIAAVEHETRSAAQLPAARGGSRALPRRSPRSRSSSSARRRRGRPASSRRLRSRQTVDLPTSTAADPVDRGRHRDAVRPRSPPFDGRVVPASYPELVAGVGAVGPRMRRAAVSAADDDRPRRRRTIVGLEDRIASDRRAAHVQQRARSAPAAARRALGRACRSHERARARALRDRHSREDHDQCERTTDYARNDHAKHYPDSRRDGALVLGFREHDRRLGSPSNEQQQEQKAQHAGSESAAASSAAGSEASAAAAERRNSAARARGPAARSGVAPARPRSGRATSFSKRRAKSRACRASSPRRSSATCNANSVTAGQRAMLGFVTEDVERGVRVASVTPNGPAAEAGLEVGDTITEIDGAALTDTRADRRRQAVADRAPARADGERRPGRGREAARHQRGGRRARRHGQGAPMATNVWINPPRCRAPRARTPSPGRATSGSSRRIRGRRCSSSR